MQWPDYGETSATTCPALPTAGHVPRYGSLRNRQSQLEKLAMDPWSAPSKILTSHTGDQLTDFRGDLRAPASPATTRAMAPQRAPTVSTPTQNGLRLDDHQALTPLRPAAREQDPEQPIDKTEAGTAGSASLQNEDWWRNVSDSRASAVRVRGSFRATGSALTDGVAMHAR